MDHAATAHASAEKRGLLQCIDPRVKVTGLLAFIIAAVSAREIGVTLAILAAAIVLAKLSLIPLRVLAIRVWGSVLGFTGMIALPAIFSRRAMCSCGCRC